MPSYQESKFSTVPQAGTIKADWWKEKKKEVHRSIWGLLHVLQNEQRHRDYANRINYSMFLGQGVSGLEGNRYALRHRSTGSLRVNLARSISSAANSKLAKNKVRILYLTEGGDWSQQARAKRITKVVNGTFHASDFYQNNAAAQLDSAIFDVGAVYFYTEGTKIKTRRVPGNEIRVDYMDARYGSPTQLHREVVVPRNEMLAQFPKQKKLVMEAPMSKGTFQSGSRWISDCIDVCYSWHLPTTTDGDDGIHAITVPNGTIETTPYKHDYFPFVFHKWETLPYGFYGISICQILVGIQYAINKMVQDIQEHADLSTGFVAIESGSQFNKQALTNEVWRVVETTGQMPQYIAPPPFQMEKIQWLDWLINRGHEDTGLSQLFVTSRKPDGLDSGKALREYQDQNSERFQMAQQRFEQSHVDAARIITGLYEDIYEAEGAFEVKAFGQKVIETIDWEEARMDEEDYAVRPVPTSFLPSTPAAKLQTIQEMLQGGMLGREEAMLLLDYPDLERVNTLQGAPLLNIEWRIEKMLDPDDPKYLPPEPTMNLQLAIKLAETAYNDAQVKGAPEENLELLRRFMSQANYMVEQAQQPPPGAQPMPGAPGMPPEGGPPPEMPMPPEGMPPGMPPIQ